MHKARENGTATQTWPCTYISDTVSASIIWEKKCERLVLCSTVNRILFHKAFWAWQNQQPCPAWWNICPFQLLHTPVFFVHQRLYSAVLLLYCVSLYWVCEEILKAVLPSTLAPATENTGKCDMEWLKKE